MLEIGITLLLLLFFIFPVPGLALCLGAWTCYLIYSKLVLLNHQPPRWKKIVWIHFLTGTADTILSFVMAFLLALTIYFVIFDGLRLFLFNLIFCFLISFRWFDFTHVVYRHLILSLQPLSLPPPKDSVFCMMIGQRSGNGIGIGMKAISLDSGYTYWNGHQLVFEGIMSRKIFSRSSVLTAEKISSEKIKITPAQQNADEKVEAWTIVIRQQFYPFKTKKLRDQWFQRLSDIEDSNTSGYDLDEGLSTTRVPSA
jgi:hypothetical protein